MSNQINLNHLNLKLDLDLNLNLQKQKHSIQQEDSNHLIQLSTSSDDHHQVKTNQSSGILISNSKNNQIIQHHIKNQKSNSINLLNKNQNLPPSIQLNLANSLPLSLTLPLPISPFNHSFFKFDFLSSSVSTTSSSFNSNQNTSKIPSNLPSMIHQNPSCLNQPSSVDLSYKLPEASQSAPDLSSPIIPTQLIQDSSSQSFWNHERCQSELPHEILRFERRFQAILEIINTEIGYLRDLQILEEIYLKKIDSLNFLKLQDKQTIRRNIAQVIELAERFLKRLNLAVGSKLDYWKINHHRDETDVDRLIERVAKAFISESPIFTIYEEFCSKHTEANDIIRLFESSPEWISLLHQSSSPTIENFILSPPSSSTTTSNSISPPNFKLSLQDYIIKPIQRIMRYPMLLNSLLKQMNGEINPSESRAKDKVYQALWAMKEVADGVDEARSSREIELKTELIASRMELHSSYRTAFVSLLGQIKLVGSLHLLYHGPMLDPNEAFKIKYHGIFLYQTHMVIVKVKRATVYEPRHWFPIRYFDLMDIPDSSGLMPYSFSLKYRQHTFEFGATCESEKKCWINKLREIKEEVDHLRAIQIMSDLPPVDDSIVSSINLVDNSNVNIIDGIVRSGSPIEEDIVTSTPLDELTISTPAATQSRVSQRFSKNVNTLLGRTAEVAQAAIDLKLTEVFSEVLLCARLQDNGNNESAGRSRTLSAAGSFTKRNSHLLMSRGTDRKLKRMSCMESNLFTTENVPPLPIVINNIESSSGTSSLRRARSGPALSREPFLKHLPQESDQNQNLMDHSTTSKPSKSNTLQPNKTESHGENSQTNSIEKEEKSKQDDSLTMQSSHSHTSALWLPGLKIVRRFSKVGSKAKKSNSDGDKVMILKSKSTKSSSSSSSSSNQIKEDQTKRQITTPIPMSHQQNTLRRVFMKRSSSNHRFSEKENQNQDDDFAHSKHLSNSSSTSHLGTNGIGSVFRSMMRLTPLVDSPGD